MSPFYWSNLNFFRTLYVLHTGTLEFGMFTGSFAVLDKHNCRLKFSYDCYIPILEFQAIPCNSIKVVSSILESSKHYNPWPQKLTTSFIFCKRQSEQQKTGAHSLKFGYALRFVLLVPILSFLRGRCRNKQRIWLFKSSPAGNFPVTLFWTKKFKAIPHNWTRVICE